MINKWITQCINKVTISRSLGLGRNPWFCGSGQREIRVTMRRESGVGKVGGAGGAQPVCTPGACGRTQ